jgi:hypothetical protein
MRYFIAYFTNVINVSSLTVIPAIKEIQHDTGCLNFVGAPSRPQQSDCCAQLLAEWTAGSQGAVPDTQPHWYDCRLFFY